MRDLFRGAASLRGFLEETMASTAVAIVESLTGEEARLIGLARRIAWTSSIGE
ncbi:MAG: hypothetical protein WBV82_06070 [Myxococcaceae bacterium]